MLQGTNNSLVRTLIDVVPVSFWAPPAVPCPVGYHMALLHFCLTFPRSTDVHSPRTRVHKPSCYPWVQPPVLRATSDIIRSLTQALALLQLNAGAPRRPEIHLCYQNKKRTIDTQVAKIDGKHTYVLCALITCHGGTAHGVPSRHEQSLHHVHRPVLRH